MNFDLENGRDYGSTSSTLLELVIHDDATAWGRLVRLYAPLVFYWCHQAGLSMDDSCEVGQEAFFAIHSSLRRYRLHAPGTTFRGWMRTITKRKIADVYRVKAKRLPSEAIQIELEGFADAKEIDSDSLSEEKRLLYHRAMQIVEGEFQEKHQRAFSLMILEGWRAKEVAIQLEMTVNAVYLARHHILKRLKSEFADLLD